MKKFINQIPLSKMFENFKKCRFALYYHEKGGNEEEIAIFKRYGDLTSFVENHSIQKTNIEFKFIARFK